MAFVIEKSGEVPVLAQADVLVVGGGPSGLAAAIAAARCGVSVLLVERFGCFGGNITVAGVEGFAWYRHEKTVEAGGLTFEFERRFAEIAGANPESQSDSQALDAEMFKYVADVLVEEAGVTPVLHCMAADAIIKDGVIKGVITQSKSGRQAFLAKVVVDCTGDADVAALAGADFTIDAKPGLMCVTTIFSCRDVDTRRFRDYITTELKPTVHDWGGDPPSGEWSVRTTGKEDGLFSPYFDKPFAEGLREGIVRVDENVSLGGTWSSITDGGDVTQLNIVFMGSVDATDVLDLTKAEITGRRNALRAIEIMRKKVPGFENARLRNFGMTLGTRESRQIVGRQRLTGDDVLNEARFDDSVGVFPEFVDGVGRVVLPTTGRYYQIPYGCLVPTRVDNLLVAGRAISGDKIAHASFRSMSCCVTTGQAAGVAAAMAVKSRATTATVDVRQVQEAIQAQGVRIF